MVHIRDCVEGSPTVVKELQQYVGNAAFWDIADLNRGRKMPNDIATRF